MLQSRLQSVAGSCVSFALIVQSMRQGSFHACSRAMQWLLCDVYHMPDRMLAGGTSHLTFTIALQHKDGDLDS